LINNCCFSANTYLTQYLQLNTYFAESLQLSNRKTTKDLVKELQAAFKLAWKISGKIGEIIPKFKRKHHNVLI